MLTTEERKRRTETLPVAKGLVWFTDLSGMKEGNRAGMYGQTV